MKPLNRQNNILSILRAMQREVSVDELAEMMAVSNITIRRDLDQLAGEKTIIRTHGGCLSVGRAALETEYHKRVRINFSLKQAIGKAASEIVGNGDILLLNDGSTTFHLGAHLGSKKGITVFTNSLALVTEVSRFDNLDLYIVGGKYNSEQYSLRGSMLEQILENYTFDKVFIGADAIDQNGRCFVSSTEESRLTELMLRIGRKKILLADHTKVKADSHCVYASLSDFDTWITTDGMDNKLYSSYSEKTEIIIAGIL
ncbi:MAG: DeoR/GlpR family DNA-binding transcription regulator [Spirochaetales bacterium]|nr:DeoR/GlpR family DNA-binding transcription regulator [Spirochaetales bacterium]